MDPFLGSQAIADGTLTRAALRWRYEPLFPNVYVPKDGSVDLRTTAMAAWLWSGSRGIIAGRTAAGLYGVPWIRSTEPIEIIARNTRHPAGVVIRRERIAVDEIGLFAGMPITTPARTAVDLARHIEGDEAVEYLDALAANTELCRDEIWYLVERFRDTRGIAVAREALVAMDDGVGSRWETRVRLMVRRLGGVPPPRTSIRVSDVVIAMGWPRWKVGIDCGPRPDDESDFLHRIGWTMVAALPQHTRRSIIARARTAVWARAMPPSVRSAAPRSGTA
ncbi:hypothetical protein [Mycolicibacterium sp. J2]|uniref:hypothetical protein n=1 Tax=Mycolicibacterium sp. J2 TaxID=2993511 RepID=UPI00224B7569|nr:hypothetical protein [Mycolicibacterium sp. J2]MCX2714194.1 hypothetical protein [Mycolicibacterium sp. J2]